MVADHSNNEPEGEEEAAGANLMKMMAPVIFEKAILGANNDEERKKTAFDFAMSPVTDFDIAKKCIRLAAAVLREEGRSDDGMILLDSAKHVMNSFLNERTETTKNGVSIQKIFDGEIVHSIGHALNEGITEKLTIRVMGSYTEKALGEKNDDEVDYDGSYKIEVAAACLLGDVVGEQLVDKAYFGDMETWSALEAEFEEKFGKRSFMKFLNDCDVGDWKGVFQLLRSGS